VVGAAARELVGGLEDLLQATGHGYHLKRLLRGHRVHDDWSAVGVDEPSSIRWVAAQHNASAALGVEAARIYGDHSLTGTNRERPGLREALAPAEPGTPTQ
jgi:hypothetical protein